MFFQEGVSLNTFKKYVFIKSVQSVLVDIVGHMNLKEFIF